MKLISGAAIVRGSASCIGLYIQSLQGLVTCVFKAHIHGYSWPTDATENNDDDNYSDSISKNADANNNDNIKFSLQHPVVISIYELSSAFGYKSTQGSFKRLWATSSVDDTRS